MIKNRITDIKNIMITPKVFLNYHNSCYCEFADVDKEKVKQVIQTFTSKKLRIDFLKKRILSSQNFLKLE